MGDFELMVIFAFLVSLSCLIASLWLNNEGGAE
jgi:hypothetical protein